ncbi:hypothetical protein AX16_004119 [Volvariella volvacea WC 439]|nr:hypothetical protein AX16_004119 [Volvariella volvacea WC 439]
MATEKTPPPHQSRSYSQGTASHLAYTFDKRAGSVRDMHSVDQDLENTQTVPFNSMLVALIARMMMNKAGDTALDSRIEQVLKEAQECFQEILDTSVEFTNSSLDESPEGEHEGKVERDEGILEGIVQTPRYAPFANALNVIMTEYRDREFENLTMAIPSSRGNQELILIPNDPQVIQAHPATYLGAPIKRKPDIIAVYVELLKILTEDTERLNFDDMVTLVAKGLANNRMKAGQASQNAPGWDGIRQTWELKASKKIDASALNRRIEGKDVILPPTTTPTAQPTTKPSGTGRGRKRERSATDSEEGRSESKRHCSGWQGELPLLRMPPGIQCANYAIEHLGSGWCVSHCIVMFLEAKRLCITLIYGVTLDLK